MFGLNSLVSKDRFRFYRISVRVGIENCCPLRTLVLMTSTCTLFCLIFRLAILALTQISRSCNILRLNQIEYMLHLPWFFLIKWIPYDIQKIKINTRVVQHKYGIIEAHAWDIIILLLFHSITQFIIDIMTDGQNQVILFFFCSARFYSYIWKWVVSELDPFVLDALFHWKKCDILLFW